MKKTTYMILAVGILIIAATIGVTKASQSKDDLDIHTIGYSHKTEKKQLPKFSHLVIKSDFSHWYEMYNRLINNDDKFFISANLRNEIQLSKELMDYSTFVMHGDTMVITLGCAKDFGRNLYREISKDELSEKVSEYTQCKYRGRYYQVINGAIKAENPFIVLHVNGNIKSITYSSIFGASVNKLRQDSLNLNTGNHFSFNHCSFGKLNVIHGKKHPDITLNETNISKFYVNIEDYDHIGDECHVNELFLKGNIDSIPNDRRSLPLSNHPVVIHWMPREY